MEPMCPSSEPSAWNLESSPIGFGEIRNQVSAAHSQPSVESVGVVDSINAARLPAPPPTGPADSRADETPLDSTKFVESNPARLNRPQTRHCIEPRKNAIK